jgi:hypothetical protein
VQLEATPVTAFRESVGIVCLSGPTSVYVCLPKISKSVPICAYTLPTLCLHRSTQASLPWSPCVVLFPCSHVANILLIDPSAITVQFHSIRQSRITHPLCRGEFWSRSRVTAPSAECKMRRIFENFRLECRIFGGVTPNFVGCRSAESVFWGTGQPVPN